MGDRFHLMMFGDLRTSAELSMTPNFFFFSTFEGDKDGASVSLDGMATIILVQLFCFVQL